MCDIFFIFYNMNYVYVFIGRRRWFMVVVIFFRIIDYNLKKKVLIFEYINIKMLFK